MLNNLKADPESTLFALQNGSQTGRRLHLLIVEDDSTIRGACEAIATEIGFATQSVESVSTARRVIDENAADIVLLDLRLGTESGLVLLNELQTRSPRPVVIVMTAFATVGSAVAALRAGAFDYLQKPFSIEELTTVLETAIHYVLRERPVEYGSSTLQITDGLELLGDRSPAIGKIRRIVSRVALSRHPVLIVGEPGTGKDILARSIHLNGPTSSGPFLSLDCNAISATDIERLLFDDGGSVASGSLPARSGALTSQPGGTLFFNEISGLPSNLQMRLLHALEDRAVRPSGSSELVPVTARVLAASSTNLTELVNAGHFRRDLFLRLNVVNLYIPPLRERKDDIPTLSARILDRITRGAVRRPNLHRNAMQRLIEYDWPGNLRELECAIEYACVVSSGAEIHLSDLPQHIQDYASNCAELHAREQMPTLRDIGLPNFCTNNSEIALPMAEIEKKAILGTLRQLNGDKLLAAKVLGIGKTTLYRKLKEYEAAEGYAW